MQYALSIDLGTTNTTAAVMRRGSLPVSLRLSEGANSMPSGVLVWEDGFRVGDEAWRLVGLDPSAYERTPKRRLAEPPFLLGSRFVSGEELITAVIAEVLRIARDRNTGQDPAWAVLTHPHSWSPSLRAKLRNAAIAAGLSDDTLHVISEPVAAAWSQGTAQQLRVGQRLGVIDFGGGTFDAAIVERVDDGSGAVVLAVRDAIGLDPLGGDDFDGLLEDWALDELEKQGHAALVAQLMEPAGLGARITLREELRRAKHALSSHATAPIAVSLGGVRQLLTITQPQLEALVGPEVNRALEATRSMLDRCGPATVDRFFLTGGASLMPIVQREFQQLTEGRVMALGDPKDVTALGALIAQSQQGDAREPRRDVASPSQPPRANRRGWVLGAAAATLLAGLITLIALIVPKLQGDASASGPAPAASSTTSTTTSATTSATTTTGPGTTSGTASSPTSSTPSPVPSYTDGPPNDTTDSTDPNCPGLTAGQCAVVNANASLIQFGSCRKRAEMPVDLVVDECIPLGRKGSIADATILIEAYYRDVSDVRSTLAGALSSWAGPSASIGKDILKPPAISQWKSGGVVKGGLWSVVYNKQHMLIWSDDSKLQVYSLVSEQQTVAALYKWFLENA